MSNENKITYSGYVKDVTRNALSGYKVSIRKKILDSSEKLGEGTTDSKGKYNISFEKPAGKKYSYTVEVYDSKNEVIISSNVIKGRSQDNFVNLTVDLPSLKGQSKQENLKKALDKVLIEIKENTKTKKLTRKDIELISFQSDIPAKEVWYYLKAKECEDNTGMNAEIFYGLFKSGKKTNLIVLSSLSAKETESSLKRAAENNFISSSWRKHPLIWFKHHTAKKEGVHLSQQKK